MTVVIRDIRIDAAPEVVRDHLVDPARRQGWLDEDVAATPTPDGVTYHREDGDDRTRVDIAVSPDGEGSRVTVTERIDAPAPVEQPRGHLRVVTPGVSDDHAWHEAWERGFPVVARAA